MDRVQYRISIILERLWANNEDFYDLLAYLPSNLFSLSEKKTKWEIMIGYQSIFKPPMIL